jgi:hypothetical protein
MVSPDGEAKLLKSLPTDRLRLAAPKLCAKAGPEEPTNRGLDPNDEVAHE